MKKYDWFAARSLLQLGDKVNDLNGPNQPLPPLLSAVNQAITSNVTALAAPPGNTSSCVL